MKLLFDTSVLIASSVAAHPKHSVSLPWLQKAQSGKIKLILSAHSLAECFAVLTRLPVSPSITPAYALRLIQENFIPYAEVISLSAKEYGGLLEEAVISDLSGGIIYDLLILKAAKKANANGLLTLNPRDFQRLLPSTSDFIVVP